MTTAPIPSITDEQVAEIEALASDACQYAGEDWFKAADLSAWFADDDAQFMAAASPFALRALITRLRAAERDAARYLWLRDNWFQVYGTSMGERGIKLEIGDIWNRCGKPSHVDTAIDAAMSEAKP